MRLEHVEIVNFRSIEYAKIEFDPRCRILVGKNESGKSNILKAINLLSQPVNTPLDVNDKRQTLKNEQELEESYVRFVFNFDEDEREELKESLSQEIAIDKEHENTSSPYYKKFPQHNYEKSILSSRNSGFENFYSDNTKAAFKVDYIKEERYFEIPNKDEILKNRRLSSIHWKKINKSSATPFMLKCNNVDIDIRMFSFIYTRNYRKIPSIIFADIKPADFNKEILNLRADKIIKIAEDKLPEVAFWEYSKNNILPPSINTANFKNNPDSCTPLENMFKFYGDYDLDKAFENHRSAHSDTDAVFGNYLSKVAHKTTEYFRAVWQDCKSIEFSLKVSGDKILCRVKESIEYNFSQRSDGFLRFLSFLLMISIKTKKENNKNIVLLIDEPEVGLHPSSIRCLLKELIQISEKLLVIISTHSTFMIDKKEPKRHIVVKKEEEKTIVKFANESNFFTEEILYNALGTSIFDVMKAEILLFEGYWDRKIFEIFIESKEIKGCFEPIGIAHGCGIDSMPPALINFSLSTRKCLIIADNDSKGNQGQKKHSAKKQFGEWKKYSDFDKDLSEVTGEDFICSTYILDAVVEVVPCVVSNGKGVVFSDNDSQHALNLVDTNVRIKNTISLIENFIKQKYKIKKERENIVDNIKKEIFENLKAQHISSSYAKLVLGIAKHFELKTEPIEQVFEDNVSKNKKGERQLDESATQDVSK